MSLVLLYPQRNGTGGGNKAEASLWPIHLVPKMLKNGWSASMDATDPKVAEHLIEKAQSEVRATLTAVSQKEANLKAEREQFLKEKEEFEALKSGQKAVNSNSKKGEV
jgi:hypothetical protein